jgi:hypothetical protein
LHPPAGMSRGAGSAQPCGCDPGAHWTCERHRQEGQMIERGGTRAKRNEQGHKQCPSCKNFFDIDGFHKSSRRAGWQAEDGSHRQSRCKSCQNLDRQTAARVRTAKLAAIKKSAGCADCGYNAHSAALDFHHQRDKLFQLTRDLCRAWVEVEKEIAKCVVLCANCHRVRHHADR